jgi:hypothetical protein
MLTSFTIESIKDNKIYVRNTGQTTLENLGVYANDKRCQYINASPSSIAPGQVGLLTVYDIPGGVIKVTSATGFSATKTITNYCLDSIACWRFNEESGLTAYDSSGYGISGYLVNMGTGRTDGKSYNALQFDGTDDMVNVTSFQSLNGNWTMVMWAKPVSNNSAIYYVVGANGGASGVGTGGIYINRVGRSNRWGIWNGSAGDVGSLEGSSTPANGQWYHLSAVKNGNTVLLYLNGNLDASSTIIGGLDYSNLVIGKGNGYYFNGTIDEVRVWNRVLSSAEILNLYITS